DGRCLEGANLIAGEWGHNPLPWATSDEWPGPPCYCGKRGCIESWLSGPGFERDHAEHTGRTLPAREIARAAADGDAGAAATPAPTSTATSTATPKCALPISRPRIPSTP